MTEHHIKLDGTPSFTIATLGPPTIESPLPLNETVGDQIANYVSDDARLPFDPIGGSDTMPSFELAGPRRLNHFEGGGVRAGMLTCGGLCPGLNDVIRGLVLSLWHNYGVRTIFGFRYGYQGLMPHAEPAPLLLNPKEVSHIHLQGGTMLGSSRGPQPVKSLVDTLERLSLDMLFIVGGDGGMRGADAVYQEVKRRELSVGVIGVPKTIDNDLPFIERTFGFATAVSVAAHAIRCANVEAEGAPNGVGLIKLMGRHAGFIAAAATLASRDVNLVLVPELPFDLDGDDGVLGWLERRLADRGHAVIVVAEGAGQRHLESESARDASGNVKLGDIGVFLRDKIKAALKPVGVNLKYIDPSYIIRATPAAPADAVFCGRLAADAVHAAMAGKTGMVVGYWMGRFTHVPLATVTSATKSISLDSQFWRNVLNSTGQPPIMHV